ncbi:unnamed protein product, partial [Prorocentrum cordatum]
ACGVHGDMCDMLRTLDLEQGLDIEFLLVQVHARPVSEIQPRLVLAKADEEAAEEAVTGEVAEESAVEEAGGAGEAAQRDLPLAMRVPKGPHQAVAAGDLAAGAGQGDLTL